MYGKVRCIVHALAVALAVAGCSDTQTAAPAEQVAVDSDHQAKAMSVVEKLAAGDFAGITAMFDATMTSALPESTLRATWEGVMAQFGAFQRHGEPRTAQEMGFTAVYVPCTFERGALTAKVVFDDQGKIAGLFLQ